MLGGLCELDPLDIRDSELLLKKLFQKHQMGSENVSELGAGIGRVSQHLFRKHFEKVFFLTQNMIQTYSNPITFSTPIFSWNLLSSSKNIANEQ